MCAAAAYALLSSLQAHSDVLWELQQLDDEDDEVYYAEVFAASTLASPDRRKGSGSGIPSNRGRYDEGPRRKEGEWGENVAEYVEERRAKRDKVEKVRLSLDKSPCACEAGLVEPSLTQRLS